MTPEEFLKFKLQPICINRLRSDIRYMRKNLDDMALKARSEGREFFYYRPLKDNDWGGEIVESEPIYKYKCLEFVLSEAEYKELFGGDNQEHGIV